MGVGSAMGEGRAVEAARKAISSPLLESSDMEGAKGVIINIVGGTDLSLYEVNEASTLIQEAAHEDANIIFGAVIDPTMPEGEMRVTVIATGLDDERVRRGREDVEQLGAPANVTPLRREPPAVRDSIPAARAHEAADASQGSPAPGFAAESSSDDAGILSPFPEDEYDVPTFLRRGGREEDDEDSEEPAFLRRSAD